MKKLIFASTLLALASAQAFAQSAFVNKGAGTFKPANLVCDMPSIVATVEEGSDGNFAYISWNKPALSSGVTLTSPVTAGPGCGAGHCYYDFASGPYQYQVARTNIVDDENTLWCGRVTVKNGASTVYNKVCRTPARAVVQCITRDYAVYVLKIADGSFGYRAYNHGESFTVPSLSLNGGTGTYGDGSGLATYAFSNGPYSYSILTAPALSGATDGYARLIVSKGTTVVADQLCEAYSLGYGAL